MGREQVVERRTAWVGETQKNKRTPWGGCRGEPLTARFPHGQKGEWVLIEVKSARESAARSCRFSREAHGMGR